MATFVWGMSKLTPLAINSQFQIFVTVFLGIFIEALPFLLIGSIISGFIEEFIDRGTLLRLIPNNPFAAALIGSLMGFAFPVCECGVVPVTRRLYGKGLPLPVGISFLLAAPAMNPIALAATYTAFGWGPILIGRFWGTLLIAFVIGLIFTLLKPDDILRPAAIQPTQMYLSSPPVELAEDEQGESAKEDYVSGNGRWPRALAIGGNDFLDMARYLIIGSMLAAAMQTIVPQSNLIALGNGTFLSVITLMLLAFILSICSTVDSFVALSFVNSFTTGSILSFLVFGPMVDIKSALLFLGVFRRRIVALLIVLPLLLTFLLGLIVNLYG
ncbi:MAG: permease [Chloroflexota bacterium]